jgi:glycosyltransferase involved in cell wall biosynthesis
MDNKLVRLLYNGKIRFKITLFKKNISVQPYHQYRVDPLTADFLIQNYKDFIILKKLKVNKIIKKNPKILIVFPVYNRLATLKHTIPNMKEMFKNHDVRIYDDCSTEPVEEYIKSQLPNCTYIKADKNYGVREWIPYIINDLFQFTDQYDYIYKTDSDSLHDPRAIEMMLSYSVNNYNHPVCGFNLQHHEKNKIDYNPPFATHKIQKAHFKSYSFGISMFFPVEQYQMIHKMPKVIDCPFDWIISQETQPWVFPNTSYVEHIGMGGFHNKECNFDRCIAFKPTPYLKKLRDKILIESEKEFKEYKNGI